MALFKIEFNVKLKHDLFLFVFSFQNRMFTFEQCYRSDLLKNAIFCPIILTLNDTIANKGYLASGHTR